MAAVVHLLQLQRGGMVAEMAQALEAASKFGLTIDLTAGRWRTADGRTGSGVEAALALRVEAGRVVCALTLRGRRPRTAPAKP